MSDEVADLDVIVKCHKLYTSQKIVIKGCSVFLSLELIKAILQRRQVQKNKIKQKSQTAQCRHNVIVIILV